MANIKITDLTAYTDAASTDVLPIVDVGADVTKKIAIGDILKAVPQGTAALPGLAFDGDPNTGVYSPGADQVAISTNGTGRLFVNASGNVELSNNDLFLIRTGLGNGQISFDGTVFSLLSNSSSASLTFGTNSTEAIRIDSSGRLLVGTSTARNVEWSFGNAATPKLQVEGNDGTSSQILITDTRSDGRNPSLAFAKTRNGASVVDDDILGSISFFGDDGSDTRSWGGRITCEVDGTPGANDMPGRLVFSTTADGSSSPTERMRIKASGIVNIANTPTYADNTAALAGGLVAGDIYRKSDGTLMITY